jgi:hypothetical protein
VRFATPARRTLPAAALALAGPVVGFVLLRPSIERGARTLVQREARALGLSAAIGALRLTPWLLLELGDVVVENSGRVRVLSRSVVVRPRLSLLGLVGRAAHVATAQVLADLPGGVRLDLGPAEWASRSRSRSRGTPARCAWKPGRPAPVCRSGCRSSSTAVRWRASARSTAERKSSAAPRETSALRSTHGRVAWPSFRQADRAEPSGRDHQDALSRLDGEFARRAVDRGLNTRSSTASSRGVSRPWCRPVSLRPLGRSTR